MGGHVGVLQLTGANGVLAVSVECARRRLRPVSGPTRSRSLIREPRPPDVPRLPVLANERRKFRERLRDRVADRGITDQIVVIDQRSWNWDVDARLFDDVGIGIAEHLAKRLMRVRGGSDRRVDPRDRLPGDGLRLLVTDGPVEEVLERAGKPSGI